MSISVDDWPNDSKVTKEVIERSKKRLQAYKVSPDDIEEHFNIERGIAEGGYGRRQIYELIQNGADEILRAKEGKRIEVVLTDDYLYCANEGKAIDVRGVQAILQAHSSSKRGNEIGRFGVGFKSVLAVTDAPEFFSRSGSFRFDPEESEALIKQAVPKAARFPKLRVAFPVNAIAASGDDDVLSELMDWATTVIRLPLLPDSHDGLSADLKNFPAQFLLFSSHVGELVLSDHTTKGERQVSAAVNRGEVTLTATADDHTQEESTWRLFKSEYKLTDKARKTAGELAERDVLPLVWAVPTEGSSDRSRGQFWAFFPTHYDTTLRGVLNAPWKTNADRQNLLESEFNQELIGEAAKLVVSNLGKLSNAKDPGKHLDYLPGRGREASQWADELITKLVYEEAARSPSIPDLNGKLQKPEDVLVPNDSISEEAFKAWAQAPSAPTNWSHPSISSRTRRSRVENILEHANLAPRDTVEWLEALLDDRSPESSLAALKVAAKLADDGNNEWSTARILLTDKGSLVEVDHESVFVPGGGSSNSESVHLVHPALLELHGAKSILAQLGIGSLDSEGQLVNMLINLWDATDDDYEVLWELTRSLRRSRAKEIFLEHQATPKVKTISGSFEPIDEVLLPGPVVPADGSRDDRVAVDTTYHAEDIDLLEALEVGSAPKLVESYRRTDRWFLDYARDAHSAFLSQDSVKGSPKERYLQFRGTTFADSIGAIEALSPEGRLAITKEILGYGDSLQVWTYSHKSNNSYGVVRMPNPSLWAISRFGMLPTKSFGSVPPDSAVGPGLSHLSDVLPVVDVSRDVAEQIGLPETIDDLTEGHWNSAIEIASELNEQTLGSTVAVAAGSGFEKPEVLPASPRGSAKPAKLTKIFVAASMDEAQALAHEKKRYLLVEEPEHAANLIKQWGLQPADVAVDARATPLKPIDQGAAIDILPGLRPLGVSAELQVVLCEELHIESRTPSGLRTSRVASRLEDNTLYVEAEKLEPEALTKEIDQLLGLNLTAQEFESVAVQKPEQSRSAHRTRTIKSKRIESKILAAIGVDALRRSIPAALLKMLDSEHADEKEVAKLALAVHGVDILRLHKNDLDERGLTPPSTWAGSRAAREWVRKFGFPAEFAGFPKENREALLTVQGPPNLPPLHDYQAKIVTKVKELFETGHGRGFISLPTGAGKTRVATQSFVEALREGKLTGPILWVAQTDELCEQAVQTISETWRALGSRDSISIGRLWAQNHIEDLGGTNQIVVATIAKLETLFESEQYQWLAKSSALVIDEAHRATTPAYTALLKWQGMSRGAERVPLIGLSATPFRGTSSEETKRLATRFGKNRFDQLGDDPYGRLQKLGVLANVEHEVLPGMDMRMSQKELQVLQETRRLPAAVTQRVGEDHDRNMRILAQIMSLPKSAPVLLFAASVAHAEYMAGLLSYNGIPAKSVSGNTNMRSRQHYIEEFRQGRIRVLTNYGVLTEGFDAPSVRAVIVARPTYSPNVYLQMIGRGLRGPKNGGKPTCLIVNVEDTFDQFEEQLAYRDYEHLWA